MEKDKKRLCKCCIVGLTLCVVAGLSFPIISYLITKQVEKTVVIKEGSVLYDLWKDLPIPVYMQFYMFNVTNVQEVLRGGKPYVIQKGPYTYSEKRQKFDIVFNPNGTVSYRQRRVFVFDKSMSVGDDSDLFVTPNPVYWTLLTALKHEYLNINKILEYVVKFGGEKPFMTRSIKEVVWGYEDNMLQLAKQFAPQWFYKSFIGYFIDRNNTDDGLYTVFTGETDIQNLGVIDKYNGSSYLNFWTTKWANLVNGSDGTIAPPYLDNDRKLYLFSTDVCRSVSGSWTSNVKVKDIMLRRYTAGFMYMANATINPNNIGFCTPNTSCLDTGMINISSCQLFDYFHIPGAISFPHFYLAADQYKNSVEGLNPSAEEHQTHIDLEHNTGLVLSAAKRIQINLRIQPVDGFEETANIKPVFLPIFWINETAIVNDKYANQLKRMLFIPKLAVKIVQIILLAVGSLVLLGTVLYGVYRQHEAKKNQQNSISVTMDKIFIKGNNNRLPPITDDDDTRYLIST